MIGDLNNLSPAGDMLWRDEDTQRLMFYDGNTWSSINNYASKPIDLTDADSDYMLQAGESAIIKFTNATSAPLNIATQSGTYYECHLICSDSGGTSNGGNNAVYLNPNNMTYINSFVCSLVFRNSASLNSLYTTYPAFRCGWNWTNTTFYITNYTQYKNLKGFFDTWGNANDYPTINIFSADWRDTTTPWTSLGTITFPQQSSGYILVRRLA